MCDLQSWVADDTTQLRASHLLGDCGLTELLARVTKALFLASRSLILVRLASNSYCVDAVAVKDVATPGCTRPAKR